VVHNVIYPNGTVIPQGSVTTGTNGGGGGGGGGRANDAGGGGGGAPSTPPFEADPVWSGGVSSGWYFVTGKWTTDSKSSYEGLTLHLHVGENGSIGGFILQKKVCMWLFCFFTLSYIFSLFHRLDSFFFFFFFFLPCSGSTSAAISELWVSRCVVW